MSIYLFLSKYLKISEKSVKKVLKKTAYFMLLLFLPLTQFYAALYAIPLFAFPFINSTSEYMGYTFAFFYPKSILTVLLFITYYLVLFYLMELWNETFYAPNKVNRNKNVNGEESTF